jgi:hypothetical protein
VVNRLLSARSLGRRIGNENLRVDRHPVVPERGTNTTNLALAHERACHRLQSPVDPSSPLLPARGCASIGKNEMAAIDICAAIGDAQRQYFSQPHDGVKHTRRSSSATKASRMACTGRPWKASPKVHWGRW